MFRATLQDSICHVGLALRHPEEFLWRWQTGEHCYKWYVWLALLATAVLGTTTYGMTMGIYGGPVQILSSGIYCTIAAGLAWTIALPALYILNSLGGSKLSASTTLLAALVTVSWGGMAMIASIPVNWFFMTAVPHATIALICNLLIFAGVGMAMFDVFHRVMQRAEPERPNAAMWWLVLISVIGGELFYAFGLFHFVGSQ